MDLDRASACLRPRTPWEGLDLGFALARHWILPLWLLWWAVALPIAALCLALTGARPGLWIFVLWWLKPVYEAPLLIWASRALFGERLGWRDLRAILRHALPRGILPYLLWRRLGLARSYRMPLTLLEGLRGKAARERGGVMGGHGGVPYWLTIACYHFEAVIWGSLLLVLFFLVPEQLPRFELMAALTGNGSWAHWVSVCAYLIAYSMVAPFYVCAGFALYLSRRTELEAWDLELAFKKAREARDLRTKPPARTDREPASTMVSAVLAVVLLVGGGLLQSGSAQAEGLATPGEAKALIEQVLAGADFGTEKEVSRWVPIATEEEDVEPLTFSERFKQTAIFLARVFKWGLLGLAVIGLLLLSARVLRDLSRRGWQVRRTSRQPASASPEVEPIATDRLPEQIPDAVRTLLRAGDRRGALSLLYRASLDHLGDLGLEVPRWATEGDCLRLAERRLSAREIGPFSQITRAWQALAYAHRLPSEQSLEALLASWCTWAIPASETPS